MTQFSFVLLCYNNWNMTKQAITSLLESLDPIHQSKGIELIIVDNGSTDETQEGIQQVKEEYENNLIKIENIQLNQNMGYTPGINSGLSKCQGNIISILNNDLVFPDKWFNGLVEVLESDEKIGLVAPYLSKSSGLQNVMKQFSSVDEMKTFAAQFMKEKEKCITFTHRVIGACMVFKREVIELIGGNDIWFGLGQFDDDDWCIRTIIAGYKIAVVGKSFVHHITSVTYNQQSQVVKASYLINKAKLRRKWRMKKKTPLEAMLETEIYLKEKHYFPIKMEDFNPLPFPNFNKSEERRKFLLIADWTHPFSKWKEKLLSAIQDMNENDEIHLWVPNLYYKRFDILEEISTDINPSSLSKIKLNYDTICPSDYLIFLNSFNVIYSVEDDYVNRYMVSIASSISIPAY
ncbi:glycosyltransferase family 2 protein [Metabacillus fastidiosus]|uniref:glycosyltransferase family 2 protein n=1 Tax=Metabacillus fastidiosus TaxID=1458 RepID=UPI003D2A4BD3